MAKFFSNLIPDSITFCGESYTIDSKQGSVNYESAQVQAHNAAGERCAVYYSVSALAANDSLSMADYEALDDVWYDGDKTAYAEKIIGIAGPASPSYVINKDRLLLLMPDGAVEDHA